MKLSTPASRPGGDSLPVAEASTAPGASQAVRHVDGEQLFAGAKEVQILHCGAVYRLKRTALNKLILTK